VKARYSRTTTASKLHKLRPTRASPPSNFDLRLLKSKDLSAFQRAARLSDDSPNTIQSYPDGLGNAQDMVSLIVHNYVPSVENRVEASNCYIRSPQICGSWVMALPELTVNTTGPLAECLYSAMSTLALSIAAYRSHKNLLQLISTRYEQSLRLLAQNIVVSGGLYKNELLAAIMCLALLEVKPPKF
jgi:hypothetical protein